MESGHNSGSDGSDERFVQVHREDVEHVELDLGLGAEPSLGPLNLNIAPPSRQRADPEPFARRALPRGASDQPLPRAESTLESDLDAGDQARLWDGRRGHSDMNDVDLEGTGAHAPSHFAYEGPAAGPARPQGQRRFRDRPWRNVLSLLLFLAVSVVVIALEIADIDKHPTARKATAILVVSCFVAAGVSVMCLATWLFVTENRIYLSQIASIALLGFFAFVNFVKDTQTSKAIAWSAVALGSLVCIWFANATRQLKLQFPAVLLEMISKLVHENPTLITVTALLLFAQTVWLVVWSIAAVQATQFDHYYLLYIVLLVAFYWTTQVFRYVCHVTASGAVCHWYFKLVPNPENSAAITHITFMCLKRSLTTAFGSICYGAFFVACIQSCWTPLRQLVEFGARHPVAMYLCERPYLLVESLHHNFNKFGFSQLVMYGKSFRRASRESWDLMCARGIDSILAEDQVDALLTVQCLGGAAVVASGCALWGSLTEVDNWEIMAAVVFFVAFAMCALTSEVIESVSTTLLVCFAEEPQQLAVTNPLIFHRFVRISEFSTFRARRLDTI